jgi:hypothetical protein
MQRKTYTHAVPNSCPQKERIQKSKRHHTLHLVFLCASLSAGSTCVLVCGVFIQASHNQRETRSKTPEHTTNSAKICVEPEKSYHSKQAAHREHKHGTLSLAQHRHMEDLNRDRDQRRISKLEVHKKRRRSLSLTRYSSRDTNELTNALLMAL